MNEAARSARGPGLGRMLAEARFEVVPMSGVEQHVAHLPRGATVTITCSPRTGISATLDLSRRFSEMGYRPVPHISARLVENERHLREIISRLAESGTDELFVIGGDAAEARGPYDSAGKLLAAIADGGHSFDRIGIGGYPDHHPLIGDAELWGALAEKQAFATYIVTQLCFDPSTILRWLGQLRARGIVLPVYVGLPGALKRRRLLEISLRVGVGDSVRYVSKHGNLLSRLARRGSYEPGGLLDELAPGLAEPWVGLAGFHFNTFNQVRSTQAWLRQFLAEREWSPGWSRPEGRGRRDDQETAS